MLFLLALWGSGVNLGCAQEKLQVLPNAAKPALVTQPTVLVAPVLAPPVEPLTLEDCIQLGYQYQPALSAARSSLAAAQTGQVALERMIIPRLFTPDLGIRKEQACQGVVIAEAGVLQAEWDTRYAITRNFFTVQYIRMQRVVVDDILQSLKKGRARAAKLFGSGDPDVRITQLDLDALDIQTAIIKSKKAQVDNGMLKAVAALREAMGVRHDYALKLARIDLPPPVYKLDKAALIEMALSNRGEMTQASAASRVTELEIAAQQKIRGWKGLTFAAGSDIHAKPIPQGIFNNEYRPGAIGIEMPGLLVGRKHDRMHRASDLNDRTTAVLDKTNNLVSLDVEAQYLKWQEAVDQINDLSGIVKLAESLPVKVQDRKPTEYTSTIVIQANTTAIMVRTQLNDALHMHALALAGLERATAGAFQVYPVPAEMLPKKK